MIKTGISQVLYRTQRVNKVLPEITLFDKIFHILCINMLYLSTISLEVIFSQKGNIKLNEKADIIKSIPFFLISLMPIAWYIVLGNHTMLHMKFVYRHMTVFLCGICLGLSKIFQIEFKTNNE